MGGEPVVHVPLPYLAGMFGAAGRARLIALSCACHCQQQQLCQPHGPSCHPPTWPCGTMPLTAQGAQDMVLQAVQTATAERCFEGTVYHNMVQVRGMGPSSLLREWCSTRFWASDARHSMWDCRSRWQGLRCMPCKAPACAVAGICGSCNAHSDLPERAAETMLHRYVLFAWFAYCRVWWRGRSWRRCSCSWTPSSSCCSRGGRAAHLTTPASPHPHPARQGEL
jgi:hypothetical protein